MFVYARRNREPTTATVILGTGWCLGLLLLLRAASVLAPIYSGASLAAAFPAGQAALPIYSLSTYDQTLPFYLQHSLGRDAFTTGLYMTPWPLVVAVVGPIAGRLADRISNGLLCAAGGLSLAIGLALASGWPLQGGLWPLVVFLMLSGFGFGIFQTPNNRNMLLSAPRERSGAAGGMQGTARLLGQTVGSVIMAVLFTVTSSAAAPRIGLAVGAALALAGGLVSALRIDHEATRTERLID